MYIVAHNLLAMNAQRQFGINTNNRAKNMEKLSSGYKVNRAADDAAGLAISEKMRRQIRGLDQGSENIQDGISLVQVADGALAEVTDMLQRINELSVKAYNDTHTEEDRDYIQQEVTELIKEIEDIADRTTFNEIPVLKGNPTEMVTIQDGYVYTGSKFEEKVFEVPQWLKQGIDTDLTYHSENDALLQDASEYMVKKTDAGEIVYYGPAEIDSYKNQGYRYAGAWQPTLAENATAKISFSGLTACDDAKELYQNVFNMMGCSIGVPCGTCSTFYGISYAGDENGMSIIPSSFSNGASLSATKTLDLSMWKGFTDAAGNAVNIFDKIKELVKEQEADSSLSDAAKKTQTLALADEIARKLRDKSVEEIQKVVDANDHYDRVTTKGDYDIIMYDYRDNVALQNLDSADSKVQVSAMSKVEVPYSVMVPGTEVEMEHPLWVVASAQNPDRIPIDLPLIDCDTLGITGYDVSRYSKTEVYSDEYKKKLQDWENDYTIQTITRVIPAIPAHEDEVPVISFTWNANGEVMPKVDYQKVMIPEVPERTIQDEIKQYNSPKPVPGAGDVIKVVTYDGDSNRKIADALSYVVSCRSRLGAQQNRLEHAYNNNENKHENLTAAESRIRDTDMAKEMVTLSKNDILLQAGQAIMAQANQSNQGVLSLLS